MKVCQLCAVGFTAHKFLLPLIDGQVFNGDEVTLVCSDGEFIKEIREKGYHVDTLTIARNSNIASHLVSMIKLYRYFRRQKFDLIHVHTPVAALLGRISAKLAGVPYIVYTAHGFYFHDDMPRFKRCAHIALEKFAGKLTDLLFTQSTEDATSAVELGIMRPERIFAIGNGVDVRRFESVDGEARNRVRQEFGIPNNAFVIGMIGRQVEEKGVIEFLQATQGVVEDNRNVYVLLVGERLHSDHSSAVDGVLADAVIQMKTNLALTGMRDDIPDLLGAMDVFCLPSWREGMPRTIIEAMMMALPIVATNIRGSREEVSDGETGLIVPVKSPKVLQQALQKMVDNPEWAKSLGMAGKQRALALYDESKVVAKQLELIRQFSPHHEGGRD